ncbi:MAG: RCC1 domain-containing protein [Archangium sp.]
MLRRSDVSPRPPRPLRLLLAVLALSAVSGLGCGPGPYTASLVLPPNAPPRESIHCARPRCVQELAAGAYRTCARLSDGAIYCWGNNTRGQLLDGTTTNSPRPLRVEGLSGVARLVMGVAHTCALLTDGTVACWGYNTVGQTGHGATSTGVEAPVRVRGLSAVVELASGDNHTCARVRDGSIWCWGSNESGQLGLDRSARVQPLPVRLPDVPSARALALGSRHTCVLAEEGSIRCWGWRQDLGLQSLPGATGLALGGLFGCALMEDGSVRCWGQNDQGQLGNGRQSPPGAPLETVPAPVVDLDGAVELAASLTHACARRADGTVRCWGANWSGEVGDGSRGLGLARPSATPVQGLRGVVQVVAGGSCQPAGGAHGCALLEDGTVRCWGDNGSGQLGDGTTESRPSPTPVVW